ncbi:MAG: nitroreductase family protein [Pseudomonadota bacterium]
METAQAIRERRAVKHYDASYSMPEEDRQELLELALQAPTSFNIQNWRFVLVEDQEKKQQLREAAWDQAQVTDAAMTFVLCADVKAWDKDPARYWKDAPKEAQDILVPMIQPFYEGKDWQQRDEAMRSVGIVAQTLMLAAKDKGYDSCPMIGFDTDKVAEIINLPDDHVIGMMLVIGKALKPAWPKPGQLPLDDVLKIDSF